MARKRSAFATVIVLALVAVLLGLIAANAHILAQMKAELKRVESRQLRQPHLTKAQTNQLDRF